VASGNLAAHWEAAIRNKTIAILQSWLLALFIVVPVRGEAAELQPAAAQGLDHYVELSQERMQRELQPGGPFLWVDGLPDARRQDAYTRLQRGDVVTSRLETRDVSGQIHTPGALIHHWVGTVFLPGASVAQVLKLLQDYDHDAAYYSPEIVKSKTLEHTANDFKVYFRLRRKKVVTVVLDTEYDVHYQQLDAARAQSHSYSTRIAEVENAGEPDERQLTPGNDHGFLWRLYSYWRFSQKDGGAYVQCEAISLTRDVPTGLNWLVGPFIESIPRESLEFTLRSTRTAVLGQRLQVSQ
jgi:hypothetical protein